MAIPDPVIVLALPRSFSSVTSAALGQHPEMYELLETQVFEVESMREWWQRYGNTSHDADGLTRVVAEVVFGRQTFRSVRRARWWLWMRRHWRTSEIISHIATLLQPLAMVEKTPIEGRDDRRVLEKLTRREHMFPTARYVHLVRHPVGYGRSHLEHLGKMAQRSDPVRMRRRFARMLDWRTNPPTLDPQILWQRVNGSIARFLRDVPSERWVRVRGEDLVANPDAELRQLAEWLGVSTSPDAIDEMRHPERSPFASLGPANARFGGDPKFFRDPVLRVGSRHESGLVGAVPWRRDGIGFFPEVKALAAEFGYH